MRLITCPGAVEQITCTVVAVELITSKGGMRMMVRGRMEMTSNPMV